MYKVVKRDGMITEFDISKISLAITKAFEAQQKQYHPSVIDMLALRVTADFEGKIKDDLIQVEDIQDSVESILIQSGYSDVAKAYILYRKQREKIRNMKSTILDYKELVDSYVKATDWRVKENSTVTYSVGGLILNNSGAITANYWLSEIYDEEIANAHRSGDIHLHDLSMLTGYCAGWSLKQLILEGLGGVPGKITSKPAKHLASLCNQMVNFLGIMQNEWAGAQAFSSFDTYLAPFVKVDHLSYDEVKKCVESFVYGVNTPLGHAGAVFQHYPGLGRSFRFSAAAGDYRRSAAGFHLWRLPERNGSGQQGLHRDHDRGRRQRPRLSISDSDVFDHEGFRLGGYRK